jgi:hypothetical protein
MPAQQPDGEFGGGLAGAFHQRRSGVGVARF